MHTTTSTEWVANSAAPDLLASLYPEAGKTPSQWATWLTNNRNQSRQVPYRIPYERLEGLVVYKIEELHKFIEWDKRRDLGTRTLSPRAAEALRAFGGTEHGRPFKGGAAILATDATGVVFVQMAINEPLTVFAMTPDQAIAFGSELLEAGEAAKQISSGKPTEVPQRGKVLADNATWKVTRIDRSAKK